jgi:hypothetical protein
LAAKQVLQLDLLLSTMSLSRQKAAKPPPWEGSDARLQLKLDIEAGDITAETPFEDVFDMWPDLYHIYGRSRFKGYLKTLLKKKVTAWKDSEAKAQLELDIIGGFVTEESDPNGVYDSRPQLFHLYTEANFKTNLKSLLKKFSDQENRAEFDKKAHSNDRNSHPFPMRDRRGNMQWTGSKAQRKLNEYIDSGSLLCTGRHQTQGPLEFRCRLQNLSIGCIPRPHLPRDQKQKVSQFLRRQSS